MRWLLLLLLALCCQVNFAQENVWTLEHCVEQALSSNPAIKQSGYNVQGSRNTHKQTIGSLFGSASADASYNFNFGNSVDPTSYAFVRENSQSSSVSASYQLPLFTGLQQINNIRRTSSDWQASMFDFQNAQNVLALNVTSAFLNVVLAKENMKVLQQQKQLVLDQKARNEKLVKVGTLAEAALSQSEADVAKSELDLVTGQNNIDIALLTLKTLLNIPNTQDFDVSIPDLATDKMEDIASLSLDAVYKYAAVNQPNVKAEQARINSAVYSRKIQAGAFSPTLSAFVTLRDNYFNKANEYVLVNGVLEVRPINFENQAKRNFSQFVGMSLNVPLFNGWQRVTNLQNAKLNVKIRELELEKTQNQLYSDIANAYTNAKAAALSFFSAQKTSEAQGKAFEVAQKRNEVGLMNYYEYQQARLAYASAQSAVLQSKYNYLFRLKILDFYQGKKITLE